MARLIGQVARAVIGICLAGFAYIQLNDPDPLIWVVAYGLVAVLAAAMIFGYGPGRLCWLSWGVLLSLALISFPGFLGYLGSGDLGSLTEEMSPDKPYVEGAREFLGICIAGAALAWLHATRPRGES